ncbi:MAG: transposase [Rhodothermaceae bacterium]|nr:transposase [Rhodothermaceae bacterium]
MSKKILRQVRQFSPSLKKDIVGLIESGKLSVAAATREYMVSQQSIYTWIHTYSSYNNKGVIMVMDKQSREHELQQLRKRIAELEQAVGHKQMLVDFYQKYAEFLGEELTPELKKKLDSQFSGGLPNTKKPSGGK